MRELPRRTLTAIVYAAVVLLAVAAPPVVFWLLLIAAAVLGIRELLGLGAGRASLAFGALFLIGLACLGVLRAMGSLGARHGVPEDLPVWLLLVLLPTWAADVAAYLVGSAIGRRPLAPRVSPGKTWEGTIAGFVASAAIVAAIAAPFGLAGFPVVVAAIGLGPAGLAGDLLESYLKRQAGVKDSGTMLPGHGGVLDRLDSLVAAASFFVLVSTVWSASRLGSEGGLLERF